MGYIQYVELFNNIWLEISRILHLSKLYDWRCNGYTPVKEIWLEIYNLLHLSKIFNWRYPENCSFQIYLIGYIQDITPLKKYDGFIQYIEFFKYIWLGNIKDTAPFKEIWFEISRILHLSKIYGMKYKAYCNC